MVSWPPGPCPAGPHPVCNGASGEGATALLTRGVLHAPPSPLTTVEVLAGAVGMRTWEAGGHGDSRPRVRAGEGF